MTSRPHIWLLGLVHAALFALAFPPFQLWPLACVAVAPLTWLALRAGSTRQAVIASWATQFALWLWLLRWIIPVTIVGYPMLALYMSIWPTVFVWVVRRVSSRHSLARWPMTFVLPVLWVGVEFFRGDVLFYGYPWYLLGHPMIAAIGFVQSADVFGAYFISFLTAMVSGAAIDALRWRSARGSDQSTAARVAFRNGGLALAAAMIANAGYGMWRLSQTDTLSPGPRVLSIQTSVPLDIKVRWTEEDQARDMRNFIDLTQRALGATSPSPDLIVWPETMAPGIGFEPDAIRELREIEEKFDVSFERLYRWPVILMQLQRDLGIPMVIGSECWEGVRARVEGDSVLINAQTNYNSAYLISEHEPPQRYDKYFLTPFGETMPYISGWPWLERQFLNIGVSADLAFNLDSNPDLNLLRVHTDDGPVTIATPICFEDTVGRFCRRLLHKDGAKQTDLIVNLSNDGWFHSSDSDRVLHAMISRLRAIENRVPIVRSVNTGMSLHVDSCGRVRGAVGNASAYGTARDEGWLLANVQLDSRRTLYGRIGEAFPLACLLMLMAAIAVTFRRLRH